MQLGILLKIALNLPTSSWTLILFMAITAAILTNHMLKLEYYTAIACVPGFFATGLLAHAFLIHRGIVLSPDRVSNVVLSASCGFILFAVLTLISLHLWFRIRDTR